MNSGNLQDLRINGRLILDIRDAGEPVIDFGGYDHRWSASIRGWHRGHNAGTGPTRTIALAELAKQCGATVEAILAASVIDEQDD